MHDRRPIQIQTSATLSNTHPFFHPSVSMATPVSPNSNSKPIAIPTTASTTSTSTAPVPSMTSTTTTSSTTPTAASFMYSMPSAASSLASALAVSSSGSAASAPHYSTYYFQNNTPPKSPTSPSFSAPAVHSPVHVSFAPQTMMMDTSPPYQSPPESPTVPMTFSSPSSWTSSLYFSSTPHMRRMSAPLGTIPAVLGSAGAAPPPGMTGSAGVVGALSSAAAAMANASTSAPTSPEITVLGNARRRVQSLSAVSSLGGGATVGVVATSPPTSAPLTTVPEAPQPQARSGANLSRGRSLSSATGAQGAKKTKKQRPTSPMRQFILSGHSLDAL